MRGSVEGRGYRRESRQRVNDWQRTVHTDHERRGTRCNAAGSGYQDEDVFPASSVGQWRRQRRYHRGRHHAEQARQPDGRRATAPVGHDSQPHRESPLRSPGSEEAELGKEQIAVPGVAAERSTGCPHSAAERVIHVS